MFMRSLTAICALAMVLGGSASTGEKVEKGGDPLQVRSENPAVEGAAKVDVVFVLDTTGSMSGLIEGAKLKIWSIAEAIANGKPSPKIRVGLVAYRDKGDVYVTKKFDFSNDMDKVHKNLCSFKAGGGGDTPEHASRALSEAVTDLGWTKDVETLRLVFLVGDAPPHTDYKDGFSYEKACKQATKKGIFVNTIQCGRVVQTTKHWKQIAKLGDGSYAAIMQSGGMRHIATPHDAKLRALSAKLSGTSVAYAGKGLTYREARKKAEGKAGAVGGMGGKYGTARASYVAAKVAMPCSVAEKSRAMGFSTGWDLVSAVESNKVKLKDVKAEKLPENMRKMSLTERQAFVEKKVAERKKLTGEMAKLSKQRADYIRKELAKSGKKDSFDSTVLKMIRDKAAKKGIKYETK